MADFEKYCRQLGCVEKVACFGGKREYLCIQVKKLIERELGKRIVFVVDVFVVSEDGLGFEVVATSIELREPVWYKESVMKEECLKQHPELRKLVEGKGWGLDVVEWHK